MSISEKIARLSEEQVLDLIGDELKMENWCEGKTLTVVFDDEDGATRFAKLRLVGIKDKPTAADLRGEPE